MWQQIAFRPCKSSNSIYNYWVTAKHTSEFYRFKTFRFKKSRKAWEIWQQLQAELILLFSQMAGMAHDFWKTKLTREASVKQFQEIARISLPSVFPFKCNTSKTGKAELAASKGAKFPQEAPITWRPSTPACTVSKLPDGQEKAILKWHSSVPSPTGHNWVSDTWTPSRPIEHPETELIRSLKMGI